MLASRVLKCVRFGGALSSRTLLAPVGTTGRAGKRFVSRKPGSLRDVIVADVLKGREGHSFAIGASSSIFHAAEAMVDHSVGSILVTSPDGKLEGFLTERDILKWGGQALTPTNTTVGEVMTPGDKLKTVGPEDNLLKCTEQMLVNSFRHLPVLADDLAVGVISIRDIARTILQCTGQGLSFDGTTPVEDLLARKDFHGYLKLDSDSSVLECVRTMNKFNVGYIILQPRRYKKAAFAPDNVGIFTERDFLHQVVADHRRSREVSISSVMTDGSELIMVTPITKLRTCLKLMVNMNLRRLPVINGPNEIVGLLSMLDIINDSIAHEGPSSEPEW